MSAGTFAAVFAAGYAAHSFGDHWYGQTHEQALGKGAKTSEGKRHCLNHVLRLAAHKAVFIAVVAVATGLHLTWWAVALGLLVDGVSHYWADRRFTLQALADATGKGEFYRFGEATVAADGSRAFHLGTGAYAMDQSWHVLWLFITALIMTI